MWVVDPVTMSLREGTTYHFSCFFIKFIKGGGGQDQDDGDDPDDDDDDDAGDNKGATPSYGSNTLRNNSLRTPHFTEAQSREGHKSRKLT